MFFQQPDEILRKARIALGQRFRHLLRPFSESGYFHQGGTPVIGRQVFAHLPHVLAEQFSLHDFGKRRKRVAIVEKRPVATRTHPLTDVIFHPPVHLAVTAAHAVRVAAERQQEVMHSHLHGVAGIDLHLVVVVAVKFARKGSHHRLEKRVDGAHVEGRISKQDIVERLGRMLMNLGKRFRSAIRLEIGQILAVPAWKAQGKKLVDDATFHLVGGLVGEGDGQDVTVILALRRRAQFKQPVGPAAEKQLLNVAQCQIESFSRSCRCLYHQHAVRRIAHCLVPCLSLID